MCSVTSYNYYKYSCFDTSYRVIEALVFHCIVLWSLIRPTPHIISGADIEALVFLIIQLECTYTLHSKEIKFEGCMQLRIVRIVRIVVITHL